MTARTVIDASPLRRSAQAARGVVLSVCAAPHMAGHVHGNRITPRPADAEQPVENGYWEIETTGLVDWPQQLRFIEIVDNRDGTGSIYCTMVDYEIPDELPVLEGGRFYALFDVQGGGLPAGYGQVESRNAILRFKWPPALAAALAELPYRDVASLTWPD